MLDHARVSHEVSVRAPLRIALGGGGTDLPSHYREHGGFVVSAAIDRRVRLRVSTEARRFRLEHLELEEVDDPDQIRHPILRAAIARHWNGRPLHLTSDGDVPPGTGLGSSGAYTVCAVKALELAAGRDLAPTELAEAACTIEIDDLGRTVGKQDQYAAAFGGVNAFTFGRDGSVGVRPLTLAPETSDRDRELLPPLLHGAEPLRLGHARRPGAAHPARGPRAARQPVPHRGACARGARTSSRRAGWRSSAR